MNFDETFFNILNFKYFFNAVKYPLQCALCN